MAIVSTDSILESVKTMAGETPDDSAITLMENISDTFADLETRVNDTENWKTKYEENDRMWREKYTERFSSGGGEPDPEPDHIEEPPKPLTFDSLFSTQ